MILLSFNGSVGKHFQHSRTVFDRLRMADLKLNRKKCNFFKCELHYFGHLIWGKGIYMLPEILKNIENLSMPRTPKDVRQMLDLTSYCTFITAYADLIRPLTQLTHKTVPFIWAGYCQKHWTYWKNLLWRAQFWSIQTWINHTGGSCLSRTAVKLDSCLAWIFFSKIWFPFSCII